VRDKRKLSRASLIRSDRGKKTHDTIEERFRSSLSPQAFENIYKEGFVSRLFIVKKKTFDVVLKKSIEVLKE